MMTCVLGIENSFGYNLHYMYTITSTKGHSYTWTLTKPPPMGKHLNYGAVTIIGVVAACLQLVHLIHIGISGHIRTIWPYI